MCDTITLPNAFNKPHWLHFWYIKSVFNLLAFSPQRFFYRSAQFFVRGLGYFVQQGRLLLRGTLPRSTLTVCLLAGLWGLVKNAGVSAFGEVEFASLDNYKNMAEINLWGTVRVTKAFLPLIRKARGTWWAVWQDSEKAFAAQQRDVAENHDSVLHGMPVQSKEGVQGTQAN